MKNLPESCKNPKYNGKNLTNRVLVQQVDIGQDKKKITYYCPAYLRLQIKNFSEMSFEDLVAAINSVLVLTVNFRGVRPVLQQKIRPMLKLGFNRDDSLQIKQSSKSRAISMNMKQGGIYVYTIHKRIHVAMKQDVFLSPFQMIYLIMSVYIKDIQINSSMIAEILEEVDMQIFKVKREKDRKEVEFRNNFPELNLKTLLEVYNKWYKDGQPPEDMKFLNHLMLTTKEKQFLSEDPDTLRLKIEAITQAQHFFASEIAIIDKKIKSFNQQKNFLQGIQSFHFRFNFMDTDITNMKISYSAQGTYGNYDLAENLLKAEYTNISVAKKIRQQYQKKMKIATKQRQEATAERQQIQRVDHSRIKPFNYAHFEIPLYKAPSVTLTTIFFPLWLLVIIMLGIYFQSTGLADRIGSLSGLMIAFVALIPVIRQELPQSPNVTMVEVLVYMEIFTGILCFIESVSVRNQSNYQFLWYNNGFFLASAIILILQVLIIALFMILHKCLWQPSYNNDSSHGSQLSFKYLKWDNIACDKHFRRKIDNFRVQILKVDEDMEKIKQFIDKLSEKEKKDIQMEQEQMSVNQ